MSRAPGADAGLFAFTPEQAAALAQQHGTPCFVYDVRRAQDNFRRLAAALPPRVALAYAVKANPHPVLLAALAALGARFDCASVGELERAHDALSGAGLRDVAAGAGAEARVDASAGAGGAGGVGGVVRAGAAAAAAAAGRPRDSAVAPRLLYAGPGKREAELARALELGARVQAEGWEDLARVDALVARSGGGAVDVNLRVHPLSAPAEARALLGGTGPSAFGVDEEDLPELLARAAALRHVRVAGLHVFAATNQREAAALLDGWEHVLVLGRRLQDAHGLSLAQVDLGGGLGVPYAPGEAPLDVGALGAGLAGLLARHGWFGGEVLLEPGRYLAASCGDYLVRVLRTKHSRGTRFGILEGGINHLLRPLLTGQPFPVRRVARAVDEIASPAAPASTVVRASIVAPAAPAVPAMLAASLDAKARGEGAAAEPLHATMLAGPLCTALDRLGEVALPALSPGDLLAFGMVGAYGATESMGDFLSHPRPPEIWVGADGAGAR